MFARSTAKAIPEPPSVERATSIGSHAFFVTSNRRSREPVKQKKNLMEEHLQSLIRELCSNFTSQDVRISSNVFDLRRLAKLAHYAWIHDLCFHPDMFKNALKEVELFQSLSDDELNAKSVELCHHADFAKSIFKAAFDLEKLTIYK